MLAVVSMEYVNDEFYSKWKLLWNYINRYRHFDLQDDVQNELFIIFMSN